MKMRIQSRALLVVAVGMGLSCGLAAAQEKSAATVSSNLSAYSVSREVTLVGTVQAYTSSSTIPPHGPHVTLLTTSGTVDVHLGDARLLAANHFTIQTGDTLRVIGENLISANGTQFVARIIQKGTQAVVVRSIRGIPLSYMAPRNASATKPQGGVL